MPIRHMLLLVIGIGGLQASPAHAHFLFIRICEHLPRLAGHTDKLAVVEGIAVAYCLGKRHALHTGDCR